MALLQMCAYIAKTQNKINFRKFLEIFIKMNITYKLVLRASVSQAPASPTGSHA
jgi:hypothetical protein